MYLGPLGELRHIAPLAGVKQKTARFGGVHTSLTGRRTVDYLGSARQWELAFKPQPPTDDLAWLRALASRHVPGPLRLLLGETQPNRLSVSAASLGFGGDDMSEVEVSAGFTTPGSGWPAQAWPAGVPLQWGGWNVGDTLSLDSGRPAPILPGETVTSYVWARAQHYHTVHIMVTHTTRTGTPTNASGPDTTLVPDTWTRLAVSTTPDATVIGAYPSIVTDGVDAGASTPEVTLAAAQVEPGDTATDWTQGGGAPLVAVDERETTLIYSPLSQPSMTLLEL